MSVPSSLIPLVHSLIRDAHVQHYTGNLG